MINKLLECIVMGILTTWIDRGQDKFYLGDGNIKAGSRFYKFHSGTRLYIEAGEYWT